MQQPDFEELSRRLHTEGLMSLSQAAKLVPSERGGERGHIHPASLMRWILRGKNGFRLEAVRGGGSSWYTSAQAIARFMARISASDLAQRQAVANVPTQTEYERRVAAAMAEIERG